MSTTTEHDEVAARELALWIDNDRPSYEQVQRCAMNLAKHHARGNYNTERAVAGMLPAVVTGARRYNDEHGSGRWYDLFDVATRKAVAAELAAEYYDYICEGQFGPKGWVA